MHRGDDILEHENENEMGYKIELKSRVVSGTCGREMKMINLPLLKLFKLIIIWDVLSYCPRVAIEENRHGCALYREQPGE